MPSDTTAHVRAAPHNVVDVSLPLRTEHAATLRVLVTSLGADAGFSIDEIDDLKLAVSEVFILLLEGNEHADTNRADIQLIPDAGSVTVTIRNHDGDTAIELDPLATNILDSVVDSYAVTGSGITVVKRAAEASR